MGLFSIRFAAARPFSPGELRRLTGAANPYRTLIGVCLDDRGVLVIWGIIHTGARWLRHIVGGRLNGPKLPPAPVAFVHSPGWVEAYKGFDLVAKLQGGVVSFTRMDVMDSTWMPSAFSGFIAEITRCHEAARERAASVDGERWARLAPTLPRLIGERMMKRVIAWVRGSHHGGTILFVPHEDNKEPFPEDAEVDLKYTVVDDEPRHFLFKLLVDMLNRLARIYGPSHAESLVDWAEFETTTDEVVANLDEGLFEYAYLISGLASVDGAVVIGKNRHELFGFGGMISGRLPEVTTVARALDLEGEIVVDDGAETVGARHRSAYRLVSALPGAIAIVVSQDGGARVVATKDGRVTYWEQE